MGTVLRFGFFEVVLPLLFWIGFFVLMTSIANLFVLRWCRARLRRAGKSLLVGTVVLVLLQQLVLPIFAGGLAVPFSLERSVAALIEKGSRSVVEWILDSGLDGARKALDIHDDAQLLDIAELRTRLRANKAALGPESRAGRIGELPKLARAAYWSALETAVDQLTDGAPALSWSALVARTRPIVIHQSVRQLEKFAGDFRGAARGHLLLLLLVLIFVDGLTVLAFRLLTPRSVTAAG